MIIVIVIIINIITPVQKRWNIDSRAPSSTATSSSSSTAISS